MSQSDNTCKICYTDTADFAITGCNHSLCQFCVMRTVEMRMEDLGDRIDEIFACPNCIASVSRNRGRRSRKSRNQKKSGANDGHFDIDRVLDLLPKNRREILHKRVIRHWIVKAGSTEGSGSKYTECPKCDAGWIEERDMSKLTHGQCPHCQFNYCLECHLPWRLNHTCFDVDEHESTESAPEMDTHMNIPKSNEVKAKKTLHWIVSNTQQCPSCGANVQRSDGCPQMTCRCGSYFRYCCGNAGYECKTGCNGEMRRVSIEERILQRQLIHRRKVVKVTLIVGAVATAGLAIYSYFF